MSTPVVNRISHTWRLQATVYMNAILSRLVYCMCDIHVGRLLFMYWSETPLSVLRAVFRILYRPKRISVKYLLVCRPNSGSVYFISCIKLRKPLVVNCVGIYVVDVDVLTQRQHFHGRDSTW